MLHRRPRQPDGRRQRHHPGDPVRVLLRRHQPEQRPLAVAHPEHPALAGGRGHRVERRRDVERQVVVQRPPRGRTPAGPRREPPWPAQVEGEAVEPGRRPAPPRASSAPRRSRAPGGSWRRRGPAAPGSAAAAPRGRRRPSRSRHPSAATASSSSSCRPGARELPPPEEEVGHGGEDEEREEEGLGHGGRLYGEAMAHWLQPRAVMVSLASRHAERQRPAAPIRRARRRPAARVRLSRIRAAGCSVSEQAALTGRRSEA